MRSSRAVFLAGLALGALSSLSISLGLIALVAAVVLLAFVGTVSRSAPVIAGTLIGWGVSWIVLIGSTYARCQAAGPDCVSGGGELAFVGVGVFLVLLGVATGARFVYQSRQAGRTGT
jgi:hypothetical protein